MAVYRWLRWVCGTLAEIARILYSERDYADRRRLYGTHCGSLAGRASGGCNLSIMGNWERKGCGSDPLDDRARKLLEYLNVNVIGRVGEPGGCRV